MFKFAHMADIHIGAHKDKRLMGLEIQAFNESIDICIKEGVKFIIIAGDFFDKPIPELEQVKKIIKKLIELSQSNIPVYVIYGSHDYSPGQDSMIDLLEAAKLIIKIYNPKSVDGKIVIIDTSKLADQTELLIGSMIASKVFYRYRASKGKGQLDNNCPISIIIEEAPRVLSNEQLQEAGENIYSTIAREGRKFKVGLIAITQLTSLIPKIILSNLNTKIILGNEMSAERRSIIDCAAQDLSEEDKTIGSLDKGEAIVSSVFTKFAIPIYTPLFEDIAGRESKKNEDDYELKLD